VCERVFWAESRSDLAFVRSTVPFTLNASAPMREREHAYFRAGFGPRGIESVGGVLLQTAHGLDPRGSHTRSQCLLRVRLPYRTIARAAFSSAHPDRRSIRARRKG
jgi:hypothetical protein